MDKFGLSIKAQDLREKLGMDSDSPVDILSLVTQIEFLTTVYYPLGQKIGSITVKDPAVRLIVLNSSMTLGQVRAMLAHALYHLFYDPGLVIHVCPIPLKADSDREKEADLFASYFLASYRALQKRIRILAGTRTLSFPQVIALEQYFGMSHEMMCQRLFMEGYLSRKQLSAFPDDAAVIAARLGFDRQLYQPLSEHIQKRTLGHYLKQTETLREKGMLSNEEIEALLKDAFREDIASFLQTEDNSSGRSD